MRHLPLVAAACLATATAAADAPTPGTWTMQGVKQVALHTRDGKTIPIGTIDFTPQGNKAGDKTRFDFKLDKAPFTVFFLSMRNFDCIDGADVECFVPYPYDNPHTVTPKDLSWLSDNLLFMYKTKAEPQAMMANGIRYDLRLTDHGIVGKPQAVNLDDIASPPNDTTTPPYGPADRDDYGDGERWITSLTIQ